MDDGYDFKRCEKSHLQELPALVNRYFKIGSNKNYFEWRYFGNPVGESFTVVVLLNEKVVGLLSSIPTRYSIEGNEVIGVQEADLVILEEYRRLDVYLRFLKFYIDMLAKHDVHFALGFTNENSLALDLTGSTMISAVPRLVKILNAKPFIEKKLSNKYISKILTFFCNVLLKIKNPTGASVPDGMQLRHIEHFDDRINKLWQRIKEDYPIMTVRDSTYLNWRYADSMIKKYEIVCLEQKGSKEINGFVVLGEKQMNGVKRGQILDIVTPKSGNHDVTPFLLKFAIKKFYQMRVDTVDCWMFPHCHIYNELKKMGFVRREKKSMRFHLKKISAEDTSINHDMLKNINNWYLTSGDFNSM